MLHYLIYAIINIALTAYTSAGYGYPAVIALIAVYFFEAPMFPSGAAVFPPIQGAIADAHSTRISFLVPMFGFIIVTVYALFYWIQHGFKIKRLARTVDVHVVPIPGEKRPSVIISDKTIDAIMETQHKSSHASQSIDTVNHVSRSRSSSKVPETYSTGNTNQICIVAEYL